MTTLLLLALALAMDAFAAAVTQGAAAPQRGAGRALGIGTLFGVFQGSMPLIGWGFGVAFAPIVRELDHWIAFVLLAFIGARMIRAGFTQASVEAPTPPAGRWSLVLAAFATSIDAAAAGVALPILGPPVLVSCAVIGAVTLVLSAAGVLIGAAAGALIGKRAEVVGGLVLIGIGTKILIEHLAFDA